jgi:uncharacterized membrane protein YphA (DoxX/SURF4 family)
MMRDRTKNIVEILTALLICLFVYAAISKLTEYSMFVAQLKLHPLFKYFAGLLAWIIPAAELITTGLLVFPLTRRTGLYTSAALLSSFTVYLIVMISTNSHLPCTCGGLIKSLTWRQHIVFNLVFLGLAVTGIILDKRKDKTALSFVP